jgi:hypothetical protein
MSQVRIYNFGDALTSTSIAIVSQNLYKPGVYSGYDISIVDSNTIEMAIGYVLMPDGLLITETTPIQLAIEVLPNTATTYTIYIEHEDAKQLGGTAAPYYLVAGYVPVAQAIANGRVILGWIFHPGNSVPLDDYMIEQPAKLTPPEQYAEYQEALKPTVLQPPFSASILKSSGFVSNGTDFVEPYPVSPLAVGSKNVLSLHSLDISLTDTYKILIDVVSKGLKPTKITLFAQIPIGGVTMECVLQDTKGTPIAAQTFFQPAQFNDFHKMSIVVKHSKNLGTMPITYGKNGDWTAGETFNIYVNFNFPLGAARARLWKIVVEYDPALSEGT